MRKRVRRVVWSVLLACLLVLVGTMPAFAVDVASLSFEVKFVLDSSLVLDEDGGLNAASQDLLAIEPTPKTNVVAYLETSAREYDQAGWVNRIRHKDGKNKLELTYKKRYPVRDGDLQAALDLASAEGFGDEEDGWEAEVDWGDGKMTLSFSIEDKAKYPSGVSTMYELSLEDAISLVGAAMPQREDGWLGEDWGTETLADAQLVGPLSYAKYAGTVAGIEVSVEVWPIPDEDGGVRYLTELSFKADKLA